MSGDKTTLAAKIKGTVLTPGEEEYETSLKRWAANAERNAAFVVLVESAEDISATVKFPKLPLTHKLDHLGYRN